MGEIRENAIFRQFLMDNNITIIFFVVLLSLFLLVFIVSSVYLIVDKFITKKNEKLANLEKLE